MLLPSREPCSRAGCRIGVSSNYLFATYGSQDSLSGRSALRRAGTDMLSSEPFHLSGQPLGFLNSIICLNFIDGFSSPLKI